MLKAVLGELNLFLKHTGFMLSASGELPPLEEDNVISLELEENDSDVDADELQFFSELLLLKAKIQSLHSFKSHLIYWRKKSQRQN